MKKEKILKLMIVLIIGMILVTMATNVFAADSSSGVNFFDDITDEIETTENTNTETNTNTNTNINTNTENTANSTIDLTNTVDTNANSSNYNTNLPKAGLKENTMIGVAITVLAIVAVFAYKKVNQYKNI